VQPSCRWPASAMAEAGEELRRRWEALLEARGRRTGGPDRELDAAEAELYAHVRDQHHWPLSQQDPRQLQTQWRDVAWRPEPSVAKPAPTDHASLLALRRAADAELQTFAIERELAADKARLEARKAAECESQKDVDPAATERELQEVEAELRADMTKLGLAHAAPDSLDGQSSHSQAPLDSVGSAAPGGGSVGGGPSWSTAEPPFDASAEAPPGSAGPAAPGGGGVSGGLSWSTAEPPSSASAEAIPAARSRERLPAAEEPVLFGPLGVRPLCSQPSWTLRRPPSPSVVDRLVASCTAKTSTLGATATGSRGRAAAH